MTLPLFGNSNNSNMNNTRYNHTQQQQQLLLQGHGNPSSSPTTIIATTETIDGLPGGTQRVHKPVAYITFSHLKGTERFEMMVIGSVSTWLPPEEPMYVVFSKMWSDKYEEWKKNETSASRYADRIVPLFVDCPEGKFGESPCCKQEKGLLEFLDRGLLDRYDWVVYMDDDVYIRSKFLTNFLDFYPVWLQYGTTNFTNITTVNNKRVKGDPVVMPPPPPTKGPVPPVVFSGGWPPRWLGQPGYIGLDKSAYKCSLDESFTYPHGQPVVYSAAGLRRIQNGLELGGLVKQCREFDVTHDAGNAILHWMYSLPDARIRMRQRPSRFRNDLIAVHGIGRCENAQCDMADIHKMYTDDGEQQMRPPPAPDEYEYKMHEVTGFHKTETYEIYGDPSSWTKEWHTMPVSNCIVRNGTAVATKSSS